MDSASYIKQRQIQWALRRGIRLVGSKEPRGARAYTPSLNENLFAPLSAAARKEFGGGDGGELRCGGRGWPCKMQAVHSSAVLAVNLFDYWINRGEPGPIARACEIPVAGIDAVSFEQQLPVMKQPDRAIFPRDPNLDVVIRYEPASRLKLVGVECKFTEGYANRQHTGLSKAYLDRADLWEGIPAIYEVAQRISPLDRQYPCLHAAQLIKHVLGLKHACGGKEGFRLLYLWYDVPFDDGTMHAWEVEFFSMAAKADGIKFQAIRYQEVIAALARSCRDGHRAYVDYLTERYL